MRPVRFAAVLLACAVPLLAEEDPTHVVVDDAWSSATGARFSGRLTESHARAESAHGSVKSAYRASRLLLTSGEEGFVTWRIAGLEWTTRTDDEASTTKVHRTGTSLSNSLVISLSRRADAFHAIILGGSPGK